MKNWKRTILEHVIKRWKKLSNLVEISNIIKDSESQSIFGDKKIVHAIQSLNLNIRKGETLGLVGESGCGKTTLSRIILGLLESTSGKIVYNDKSVDEWKNNKDFGKQTGLVFQDPFTSLDPRMKVINIIAEPLIIHKIGDKKSQFERVEEILVKVGLKNEHMYRYPHEFSGGQRQRIAIARALITNPEFIVLDEPTSALDVSVQAQILNLLKQIKKDMNLTYLFVSHDLSVVKHISDRIAIMYLGKIVELSNSEDLFKEPKHPYTQALLSSIPSTDDKKIKKKIILKGEVPSPINPPKGCHFHPRCEFKLDKCDKTFPKLIKIDDSRDVACYLYE